MLIVDLIQQVLNSEIHTCGELLDYGSCLDCVEGDGYCPGTAFHAIAAAYTTMGYWVQADLLDHLSFTALNAAGPLLYVMSALMGLIGVAIGQPPKNYIWFIMGPVLYGWLVQTRVEVTGVQWQVGSRPMDQREVWRLSEVGLLNTNMAKRMDEWGYGSGISSDSNPNNVEVAWFFQWYDALLSGFVNGMIDWVGPYTMVTNNDLSNGATNVANLGEVDLLDQENDRWFLLSNLKWGLIENITNSYIHDSRLRDSFATYWQTTCGSAIRKAIDGPAYAAAAQGKGQNMPLTVFRREDNEMPEGYNSQLYLERQLKLSQVGLNNYPASHLRELLGHQGLVSDFANAIDPSLVGGDLGIGDPEETNLRQTLNCEQYTTLIMLALRWEAGHIAANMISALPDISVTSDINGSAEGKSRALVSSLFYGWNLKKDREESLDVEGQKDLATGEPLSYEESVSFLSSLVLFHMLKNEMVTLEKDQVMFTGTDIAERAVRDNMRQVGSKNKYGELYAWAQQMPYVQGLLLYYLAMVYPISCLLVIVPGWHKSLFTWMSFWAWVKLWDLGFALVLNIERSIWAMIGNNATTAGLLDRIVATQDFVATRVWYPIENMPNIELLDSSGTTTGLWGPTSGGGSVLRDNLTLLDQVLAIGPSLDLDLSNAYYIYIMAALYFAVPAITGQFILGSRAGFASMATGAISGVAGEAGKAAGGAFTGQMGQRYKSAQHAQAQSAEMTAMAGDEGLAAQALMTRNMQLTESAGATFAQAAGVGAGYALTQQRAAVEKSKINATPGQTVVDAYGDAGRAHLAQMQAYVRNFSSASPVDDTGASAGGDATGQVGSGDVSGLKKPVGWAVKKGLGLGGATTEGAAGMLPSISKLASQKETLDWDMQNAEAALATTPVQADANVQGSNLSPRAQGYGQAASFRQQAAQYGAAMARWGHMNNLANSAAADMAAIGLSPGFLDAGGKPVNMEAWALGGMLGDGAKQQADFTADTENGGFYGFVDQKTAELDAAYGKAMMGQIAGTAAGPEASQRIIDNFWTSFNNPNLPANNQVRDYIQGRSAAIGEMAQQAFPNGFSLQAGGSDKVQQQGSSVRQEGSAWE